VNPEVLLGHCLLDGGAYNLSADKHPSG